MQVWVSGHVQGVGFRFMTCQLAKGFDVCGQVKNLADGRVWIEVEGLQAEAEAFLQELKIQMASYIKEVEVKMNTAPRTLAGFTVAY